MEFEWLTWNDLTDEEKKQARETYISIREAEEERRRDEITEEYPYPIDGDGVLNRRFLRESDGYITVDI